MTDHYADYEALRPLGEATHVPDDQITSSSEPRRQRTGDVDAGYPDGPAAAAPKCECCGVSIPAGQSKCRFCLTNHLDDEATSTDELADTVFLGVIHLVVESTTFYGAVAKGGAAANLLSANEAEPAVDDYTLIYDLDESPARQLANQWASLPDAVQVSSEEGERLLSVAPDRTGWQGQEAPERQEQAPTRLYDQHGTGIREEAHFKSIVDEAADELWLVPAIALTETTGKHDSENQPSPVPTTERLDCQDCGRATDHLFETHESIPHETWTGQPTWKCQRCGTARHGPAPE